MMKIDKFKKNKKYVVGVLVLVVLLLVGAGMVWQMNSFVISFDENGQPIPPNRYWYESQRMYGEKIVAWQEELLERQAQDNFGKATPEETLQAFIEALKAGDTELASRYFVFNKQEQMAKELAVGKENGVLNLLIGDLERSDNGRFYDGRDDKYEFVVVGDTGEWNNIVEFSFILIRNQKTQVWKIESL